MDTDAAEIIDAGRVRGTERDGKVATRLIQVCQDTLLVRIEAFDIVGLVLDIGDEGDRGIQLTVAAAGNDRTLCYPISEQLLVEAFSGRLLRRGERDAGDRGQTGRCLAEADAISIQDIFRLRFQVIEGVLGVSLIAEDLKDFRQGVTIGLAQAGVVIDVVLEEGVVVVEPIVVHILLGHETHKVIHLLVARYGAVGNGIVGEVRDGQLNAFLGTRRRGAVVDGDELGRAGAVRVADGLQDDPAGRGRGAGRDGDGLCSLVHLRGVAAGLSHDMGRLVTTGDRVGEGDRLAGLDRDDIGFHLQDEGRHLGDLGDVAVSEVEVVGLVILGEGDVGTGLLDTDDFPGLSLVGGDIPGVGIAVIFQLRGRTGDRDLVARTVRQPLTVDFPIIGVAVQGSRDAGGVTLGTIGDVVGGSVAENDLEAVVDFLDFLDRDVVVEGVDELADTADVGVQFLTFLLEGREASFDFVQAGTIFVTSAQERCRGSQNDEYFFHLC